ncbi:RNA-directed DNA polymerase (reverse transcriptase)-related family protein [Rhynchospora pubera]|uniref:RNA-directed DNA polymerase (Reverse transcriptase)-related family protein n=1 Tax=Rhynchospora pubera TaxID=906938 RepID=A0AAV8DV64_9POAL|nr:RNA-directed DNA polymerase (reverse transcriptase)-related family protein [Rhynchospora pubera]
MSLADNKASGPDGLPNELFKLHWQAFKEDLMEIFSQLFSGSLQMHDYNYAHIILLPKTENAHLVTDFRPISIINYVPKLISKVLALRLKPFLPDLVAPCQTGFIRGRMIAENFIVAREMISHLNSSPRPSVLLKIDFSKAFDTVDWTFLNSILVGRGFPTKFVDWINLLLTTSVSSVLVNGCKSTPFKHNRGVRQGDPISPFLFLLAADVLARMLRGASTALSSALSSRFSTPFFLLQYADDTLIFSSVDEPTLRTLALVLHLFSKASGLHINFGKSGFIPFNLSAAQINLVASVLGFQHSDLPLTYLGLPLTLQRPNKAAFQPILDKIDERLAGWKSKLLSRAGRLTLACSVLSAIPSYFMAVFKLPTWLIKEIDKKRRRFIWGSNSQGKARIPLVSWQKLCLPKSVGGMGVLDLQLHNLALLLRWIWRLYDDPTSLWGSVARILYSPARGTTSPLNWNDAGSFFWADIRSLRFYFQLSSLVHVGNGASTSFWFDNWAGEPLQFYSKLFPKPLRTKIVLHEALPLLRQLLPKPLNLKENRIDDFLQNFSLQPRPDAVSWRWSSDGRFSVSSTYHALAIAGKVATFCKYWKIRVTPSIKFFLYLLFNNRLLTQEQLQRRQISLGSPCVLCAARPPEDSLHLFFRCPFIISVWASLRQSLGAPDLHVSHSVQESLLSSFQAMGSVPRFQVWLAVTFWGVWLERNNVVFRNAVPSSNSVQARVSQQALSCISWL